MDIKSTPANDTEKRFQRLVEAVTGLAIFMLDVDGNVASWTQGAEDIKGYGADEIIGQHVSVFFTEEDRRLGKPQAVLENAQTNGRIGWDGWRVRKDGSRFWASVVVDAIRDENDKLIGFAKVARDISAQRRLEERFRQVVELAPNAMVMVNTAGKIEMVNAQAERVFGYAREALLGQPIEMLVPLRFRSQHPGLRSAFFTAPQSRSMGVGRDLYALRKDGSEFPVEIGLNPIETDEGTMVLSAIVDISQRKRLEERFRQVVESAPNAMVMTNSDGRINMVNTQAERVFGYAREALLGQSIEMLVPLRFRGQHPGL
jgi:PAS domain S-box-containing protein